MKTPHGYSEIIAQFGNPANADGTENKQWVLQNIKVVKPPVGWKLYYQEVGKPLQQTSGIRLHVLLEPIFTAAMKEIWDYAADQLNSQNEDDIRKWLHERRLDQTGGGYNFRKSSGNSAVLSLHSFGIAIDWDPINNPHKKPLTLTLPDWWFAIWAEHGWSDGRHFNTPDPMHIQFATGA